MLYLGDPRLIPFPSEDLGNGVAMAVVDDERTDSRDRWAVVDGSADAALRDAVHQIATGGTRRGGRLLAPFGIRFVVVPVIDGASSTADEPLPLPAGLLDSLGAQLDLARPPAPPSFVRFDNQSAMPVTAQLTGALADASKATSVDALVGVDTSTGTPVFPTVDTTRAASGDVAAGVVTMATPRDANWRLAVGGSAVASRPAFGVATAYDVATAAPGDLRYDQPMSRTLWLIVLGVLWLLALVAASRLSIPTRLRTRGAGEDALIDLDAEPGAALPAEDRTGFGGWVDDLLADVPAGPDEPEAPS